MSEPRRVQVVVLPFRSKKAVETTAVGPGVLFDEDLARGIHAVERGALDVYGARAKLVARATRIRWPGLTAREQRHLREALGRDVNRRFAEFTRFTLWRTGEPRP